MPVHEQYVVLSTDPVVYIATAQTQPVQSIQTKTHTGCQEYIRRNTGRALLAAILCSICGKTIIPTQAHIQTSAQVSLVLVSNDALSMVYVKRAKSNTQIWLKAYVFMHTAQS